MKTPPDTSHVAELAWRGVVAKGRPTVKSAALSFVLVRVAGYFGISVCGKRDMMFANLRFGPSIGVAFRRLVSAGVMKYRRGKPLIKGSIP
jgi:hypothetical protein